MESFKFAESRNKLPIMGYNFGTQGPVILILGGVHGDEPEGVIAALGLLSHFQESFTYNMRLTLVPQFNIDGVIAGERKNAAGVDLNRNLPTKDWSPKVAQEKYHPGPEPGSEPENQSLVRWMNQNQPQFMYSLHSWNPMLNTNGNCSPEVDVLVKHTGYKKTDDIGYPTPGALGTYASVDHNIPIITYEIEKDLIPAEIMRVHVPALLEALKYSQKRSH